MPLSPLRPGDPASIGGFQLVARLGSGGMGVVYVGTDQAGRPAAVKAVKAEHAADPRFRTRFRREVEAARAIAGACTARVLDADPDADEPWLATEYVGGASLLDVVNADGPLTGDLLHPLAAGLAEALVSIHQAGVVHRDLKPANVLLAPDGPKVIDFGIAALETAALSTRTGVGLGSPGYMAPEQITGTTAIGTPADVYAWGLTVLFAATGRSPFGSGPAQALMYRAVSADVDLTGVPAWIEPLLVATLDREPGHRPTAQQVLGWLVESGTQPVRITDDSAPRNSPRRRARTGDAREVTSSVSSAGSARPAGDPSARRRTDETAIYPDDATQRVLRNEWHQPAAAQAPDLPSRPLLAPGAGSTHTTLAQPAAPGGLRGRTALIVTSTATLVLAALVAWLLFGPDDEPGATAGAPETSTAQATPSSEATTEPEETTATTEPEPTTATATTTAPAVGATNGIPSYTGELGDLDLATSFGSFVVQNHDKIVYIDGQAPNSDHIDKYFVEHPENSDYDDPHFTLFQCNGLEDGEEPGFSPAPCAATTYLIELDDDSQATFDYSGGQYLLNGFFEVDAEEGTADNGAMLVKLSGLDSDDVQDAMEDDN